jgi:hypothetical protein
MSEAVRRAGYSGTPLPTKLGIRKGSRVLLVHAPEGFRETLGELPADAAIVPEDAMPVDVAVFFTSSCRELGSRFGEIAGRIEANGGLWIAWPKRRPRVASEINENDIREIGLAAGLVDNKVCAIDDRWSGLRFVRRRKDRPA